VGLKSNGARQLLSYTEDVKLPADTNIETVKEECRNFN
jgi:hypothetical protein